MNKNKKQHFNFIGRLVWFVGVLIFAGILATVHAPNWVSFVTGAIWGGVCYILFID